MSDLKNRLKNALALREKVRPREETESVREHSSFIAGEETENTRLQPLHEVLLAVVGAAVELRSGTGIRGDYADVGADRFDEALSSLTAALDKVEGGT